MANVETYKRGQVVYALWQTFSHHGPTDPRHQTIPSTFATRVRKMGELGVPLSDDEKPGQAGIDIEYTAYHAFELAVALMLQDTGLKQAEVAFLIRNIRKQLQACYRRILVSPPVPRNHIGTEDRPKSPTCMVVEGADPKGLGNPIRKKLADTSVYLTFRYVEMREAWNTPAPEGTGKGNPPFFFKPQFHFGLLALTSEMEWIAHSNDPVRVVVEIANLAVRVEHHLKKAPVPKRGRQ